MDDNKKLPKGWGEDEEIFDNDDSGSPWENKKSDDKKAEILNEDKTNSEEVVEKKNSKDFQAAIDDNQADISPTTTSNPKPAKSKTIPILVAIIILLVAALGGVGVLFLTKNKTDDTGGSESNTEQVTDIEKDESVTTTVGKTTEITTFTTTATTTEIVTTKATTTSAPDPYAEIKEQILYSVDNEYYSGKNSYLENASPDMVFYAQEKRKELQIIDIPILSGPDASYSEIRSGYNGNAWVAAENDNWYYLQWIEGAGAFSHSCYGYVEKSSLNKKPISKLSDTELGFMYNLFYIESLSGLVESGHIEDYNGDGIDDLVYNVVNNGFKVGYYKNGEIQSEDIPNTYFYTGDEPLDGMKTPLYTYDSLRLKCREKAINHGYTANISFYKGNTSHIGYVKTKSLTGTLNLRSAPSTDSEVITQLPNGLVFNVIPDENGCYDLYSFGDWYYISVYYNNKDYTGYVSADYVVAWDDSI